MKDMIFAVDFDGTLVEHDYPKIGKPVPYAFEALRSLQSEGNKLVLYTMRSGNSLDEAVEFCKKQGIVFWGINKNPEQALWTNSPKVYAHYYIDDAAVGAPLIKEEGKRPYVNWLKIREYLVINPTVQEVILP